MKPLLVVELEVGRKTTAGGSRVFVLMQIDLFVLRGSNKNRL